MSFVKRAAVIGAGTMGAGIAAHLANAGVPTLLLDLPAEGKDRNATARAGLERARKARPGAFMDPGAEKLITLGNTEDDLAKLADVDWVVEAIIEKLDAKQEMLAKIEKAAGPHTVVTSNSSGIPMHLQVRKAENGLRKRFLGTHFFNPPRYLHLLELIPTPETDPAVTEKLAQFGDRVLGKGIVVAKDVPGFAANRIGLYCTVKTFQAMMEHGLTPDVVDVLTGPLIGRPKSATFRTADLAGVDIVATVAQQLEAATHEGFHLPEVVGKMLEKKMLGDKTGGGFYKKTKSKEGTTILTLNLDTLEYEDRGKVKIPELKAIQGLPTAQERIKALLEMEGPYGDFTRKTIIPQIWFAAKKVGEVAETAQDVDNSLKWGFGWEVGPLEFAEWLGRDKIKAYFNDQKFETPPYFVNERPAPKGAADAPLYLKDVRGKKVVGNEHASLYDVGDGVALLEFHSKANSIGQKVLEMFEIAHAEVAKGFAGLVVGNEGEHFCAGADISMLLGLAKEQKHDEIRQACKYFQAMTSALRYSPYPVVVAPHGLVLGGGCEVALWADANVASAELYTGLVEIGVGILPAGGGTTEMLIRMNERLLPGADPFTAVQQAFELIAMAKVSGSALEARRLGFLRATDKIVMNGERVLAEAKKKVLELAPGYQPPARRKVTVLGEAALANLMTGAYMMCQGGMITEYELHLARKVAEVLCGGTMNRPDEVDETVLLDLECEAFLSLSGQAKTQERLHHTLTTGKTLRN